MRGVKLHRLNKSNINIIYVFPDQYRNQAMEFGDRRDSERWILKPIPCIHLIWMLCPRIRWYWNSTQSNCPLSSPHRGSLLTGMYPNKKWYTFEYQNSNRPISSFCEDAECIGDMFQSAGYDCAYFENCMLIFRHRMIRKSGTVCRKAAGKSLLEGTSTRIC